MANQNTISVFSNFNPSTSGSLRGILQPLAVTTAVETVFTVGTDTVGSYVPAVLSIPLQSAILGSANGSVVGSNPAVLVGQYGAYSNIPNNLGRPYFSSDSFNGRAFKVRAQGIFTSGVASNDLQIGLYLGSSGTVASNHAITNINTGTAGAFGAVSGHFLLEAVLQWDVTSGKVDGILENGIIGASGVAGTFATPAALTQTSAAAASNLQFVLTGKWNASNAGNKLILTEFAIDLN
jgi:hypothetical protein